MGKGAGKEKRKGEKDGRTEAEKGAWTKSDRRGRGCDLRVVLGGGGVA